MVTYGQRKGARVFGRRDWRLKRDVLVVLLINTHLSVRIQLHLHFLFQLANVERENAAGWYEVSSVNGADCIGRVTHFALSVECA